MPEHPAVHGRLCSPCYSMRVGPSSQRRSSLPRAAPLAPTLSSSSGWELPVVALGGSRCALLLPPSPPSLSPCARFRTFPSASRSLALLWVVAVGSGLASVAESLWYALKVIQDSPDTLAARCACCLLQFYTFRTLRGALRRDGVSCVSRVCIG